MGTHYNQLTPDERYQIQALNELKFSARSIAITIGRSNKTVSRELNRTSNKDYDAQLANQDAIDKRKNSLKFNKRSSALLELIDTCLTYNFTPEQIAGRMRLEGCSNRVSLQTIYRIIYHQGWRHRLPRKGKPYRNRSGAGAGKSLIPKRCDIAKRPEIVERNIQLGHWEGDTVHGADGYFVTLVERVSKTFLFVRVKRKTKRAVAHAIKRMLAPYKGMCRTITFDNGGEFADHQSIARSLACSIYFATPYHSWERGLSENSNGLLRRYFPKKAPINHVSKKELEDLQFLINFRPRKTLNYWSPIEYLAGKRVSLMLEM